MVMLRFGFCLRRSATLCVRESGLRPGSDHHLERAPLSRTNTALVPEGSEAGQAFATERLPRLAHSSYSSPAHVLRFLVPPWPSRVPPGRRAIILPAPDSVLAHRNIARPNGGALSKLAYAPEKDTSIAGCSDGPRPGPRPRAMRFLGSLSRSSSLPFTLDDRVEELLRPLSHAHGCRLALGQAARSRLASSDR